MGDKSGERQNFKDLYSNRNTDLELFLEIDEINCSYYLVDR